MTPHELGDLAEAMVPLAARLVGAVHDDGPPEVARVLDRCEKHPLGLRALTVVLAAMVNPDATPADLLGWVTWDDIPPRQATLFDGAATPAPVWADDRHPLVDIDTLGPDPKAWTDEQCVGLKREYRRQEWDPTRRPWARRGYLEWERRRNARARARATAAEDVNPASQIPELAVG